MAPAAAIVPKDQLAIIENAGHWPQLERSDTFNRIHLDFLKWGQLGHPRGARAQITQR